MITFFKHLLYNLSILWGVVTLCFLLFFVFPDAEEMMVGQRADATTKEAIKREMGLDKSGLERYATYLNKLSPIGIVSKEDNATKQLKIISFNNYALSLKLPSLGFSYVNKKAVSNILWEAVVGTLILAGVSMIFAFIIGVILGILSGLNYGKWLDNIILTFSTLFISVPSFFSAILIAWVFGYLLHEQTGLPMTGSLFSIDIQTGAQKLSLQHLILPALALSVRPVAVITQLMRSSLISTLEKDYIRTAKAKGLSNSIIIYRHALKNSLNPVITAASGWFASLMAGAFFVEYIFNWKGIGKVLIESVQMADLPLVSGGVLYVAIIFISINIIVNISYKWLDPKLR